jgi:hypothetical protein
MSPILTIFQGGSGNGLFREPSRLTDIPLSHIKSWVLEADVDVLKAFDLKDADSIKFTGIRWPPSPVDSLLPSQLTQLSLGNVTFSSSLLRNLLPHCLPHLIILELEDVDFQEPIGRYLQCPKIKRLCYTASIYDPIFHSMSPYRRSKTAVWERLDEAFFRDTPNLGTLSLRGTSLDAIPTVILQNLPLLENLVVENCRLGTFISSFLEFLQDTRCFPTLKSLYVDDSWPVECDMSFPEFVTNCIDRRPEIQVSGNGRPGRASPASSEADSDSLLVYSPGHAADILSSDHDTGSSSNPD